MYDLYAAMQKGLKDANMNVMLEVVRLVGKLAAGLRREFGHASVFLPVLADKLKEKKTLVRDAVYGALDALADHCAILQVMMGDG